MYGAGPTVVYFPNWEARSGRIFLDVYKRCSPSKRYILKIPEPNRIESNNSGKTDGFVQFMVSRPWGLPGEGTSFEGWWI